MSEASSEQRKQRIARRISEGLYPSLIERMLGPLGVWGGKMLFQERPLPLWVSTIITAFGSLLAGAGLAQILGENLLHDDGLAVLIAWAFLGACTAMAAHILTEMLLTTMRDDILPAVFRPQDLDVVDEFLERTFRIRRQAFFVLIVGPMIWGLFFYVFAADDLQITHWWSARFVTLVACLQSAMALYFTHPVISFLHKLGTFHLRLFSADPRSSEVIVNLQHTAVEVLYVFAALFVTITVVASRLDLLVYRPARIALILMTWGPLLVVFAGAQRTFTRIITRAKYHYLRGIQQRIVDLQEATPAPDGDGLTLIGQLMDYHDRIASTPNSALNLRSSLNFINALLLPLLAFLIANWHHLRAFMEKSGGGG